MQSALFTAPEPPARFFAGARIVLNGGAVTVNATPLRGRLHAEH
jgi:transcription termination factor Rho